MKHLQKFNESGISPEIIETIQDVVLEAQDDGFDVHVQHWTGCDSVTIHFRKFKKFQLKELEDVIFRIKDVVKPKSIKIDASQSGRWFNCQSTQHEEWQQIKNQWHYEARLSVTVVDMWSKKNSDVARFGLGYTKK